MCLHRSLVQIDGLWGFPGMGFSFTLCPDTCVQDNHLLEPDSGLMLAEGRQCLVSGHYS